MNSENILSILEGAEALESIDNKVDKGTKRLKPHEVRSLRALCTELYSNNCCLEWLDGFFVGYTIPQIDKEFDLLKISTDLILNIELKSEKIRNTENKFDKIIDQMKKNYYYLHFLSRSIIIITYVEEEGFYKFDENDSNLQKISTTSVIDYLSIVHEDCAASPEQLFVPSNYLISPFNSTQKFLNGEYFLTTHQERIKKEIFDQLSPQCTRFFCISADAGTGKTLLIYDICKECIQMGLAPIIIHGANLNDGQRELKNTHNWSIVPIKRIRPNKCSIDFSKKEIIIVDEAQRISLEQLDFIIDETVKFNLPIIFAYDVKQYLKDGENNDVADYIKNKYPTIKIAEKKLTKKIRTNKEIASFVQNLFSIGSCKDNDKYGCITIDFYSQKDELEEYINLLQKNKWIPIVYTTSSYNKDPFDSLAKLSNLNSHTVIGQEFSKVVIVMDENFSYENNRLISKKSYYNAEGMLYQMATRAVNQLKIIVFHNPELYYRLLTIKNCDYIDNQKM